MDLGDALTPFVTMHVTKYMTFDSVLRPQFEVFLREPKISPQRLPEREEIRMPPTNAIRRKLEVKSSL